MAKRAEIKKIIQHHLDENEGQLHYALVEAAIEFKYIINDFELLESSIYIFSDDTKFIFKIKEFNNDPLYI